MKKKTKTVIGVILAVALVAVLVVVGFMTYLGITWTNNHEFGEYVSKEGPWGMTATWVSEDSSSYLVCKKENDEPFAKVTAYFQGVDGWQAYELHGRDRIAYLNTVENDTTIDSTSGNMKFDGTTFTITDLDKEIFGTNEFNYVITDKEFSPDLSARTIPIRWKHNRWKSGNSVCYYVENTRKPRNQIIVTLPMVYVHIEKVDVRIE